jgi:hypothetical protein
MGVARSTIRRLVQRGLADLQAVLIADGYGPAVRETDRQRIALRALAQAA